MESKIFKAALFNFSGNVGKTTLARIMAAQWPSMKIITLESINEGVTGEQMRSDDDFDRVQNALVDHDQLLLDVGASHAEDFILGLEQYTGTAHDIDYYIVPTVPAQKAQVDTLRSVRALAELGIAPEQIKLVFNCVGIRKTAEQEFPAIFAEQAATGAFTIAPDLWLPDTEIFNHLRTAGGFTIQQAFADQTDYKSAIRAETDPVQIEKLRAALHATRAAKPLAPRIANILNYISN